MPETITGDPITNPGDVLRKLLAVLGQGHLGLVDDQTGGPGPVEYVEDTGTPGANLGPGETVPLVRCVYRHGLQPGERVSVYADDGTLLLSGEVEPAPDPHEFWIIDTPFVAATTGGYWRR